MIEVGSLDSNADSNARRYTVVHQGPPKFARAPRPAAMDDNGPRQTPSGTPAGYWFESSRGSITAGVSARSTQVHCSRPSALRPPQPFDGSGRNDGRVVVELTVVALQTRSESRSEPSQALRGVLAIGPVLLQREAHLAACVDEFLVGDRRSLPRPPSPRPASDAGRTSDDSDAVTVVPCGTPLDLRVNGRTGPAAPLRHRSTGAPWTPPVRGRGDAPPCVPVTSCRPVTCVRLGR